jgi:hypothetical protein
VSHFLSRPVLLLLVALSSLLVVTSTAHAASVKDLGPTGDAVGNFNPTAVNSSGTATGATIVATAPGDQCSTSTLGHAAIWPRKAKSPTRFAGFGGSGEYDRSSSGFDINDAGMVTGGADQEDNCVGRNAFTWNRSFQDLGYPSTLENSVDYSVGLAINSAGDVAGFSIFDYSGVDANCSTPTDDQYAGGTPDGFCLQPTWWSRGTSGGARLPATGVDGARELEWAVRGIADDRTMVGYVLIPNDPPSTGAIWRSPGSAPDKLKNLIPREHGISPNGKFVVGNGGTTARFYDVDKNAYKTLAAPVGATQTQANAVNNSGAIIGTACIGGDPFTCEGGAQLAIQWADYSAQPELIEPVAPFADMTFALDIANSGHVLGLGTVRGDEHGFVLDGSGSTGPKLASFTGKLNSIVQRRRGAANLPVRCRAKTACKVRVVVKSGLTVVGTSGKKSIVVPRNRTKVVKVTLNKAATRKLARTNRLPVNATLVAQSGRSRSTSVQRFRIGR